ncbi:hypothetical protein [Rudaeicoccus suwonensis]|uniref:LemA protein n=1 Tax=Rudaeicoccus suwonensis TaxID=657409 RepID=A0A561EBA1_9MICO|nr:hypothetical protein [Rudaeicoccus suwonensis]TWE12893.1 hypothetical protein BKA23_1715 [Rudaeicoccus suwonensis]
MHVLGWVLLAIAAVALLAWYLSYTAARLDRLHSKVEGSAASLDAQIVRRAEVVLEVAHSGILDPASAILLADAAAASLDASDEAAIHAEVQEHGVDARRAEIETALSQTLRATLSAEALAELRDSDEDVPDAVDRLRSAGQRVEIARRFHNEAVRDVRKVRAMPQVRLFRLAGFTQLPQPVEFDDQLPEGV